MEYSYQEVTPVLFLFGFQCNTTENLYAQGKDIRSNLLFMLPLLSNFVLFLRKFVHVFIQP